MGTRMGVYREWKRADWLCKRTEIDWMDGQMVGVTGRRMDEQVSGWVDGYMKE